MGQVGERSGPHVFLAPLRSLGLCTNEETRTTTTQGNLSGTVPSDAHNPETWANTALSDTLFGWVQHHNIVSRAVSKLLPPRFFFLFFVLWHWKLTKGVVPVEGCEKYERHYLHTRHECIGDESGLSCGTRKEEKGRWHLSVACFNWKADKKVDGPRSLPQLEGNHNFWDKYPAKGHVFTCCHYTSLCCWLFHNTQHKRTARTQCGLRNLSSGSKGLTGPANGLERSP